MPCSSGCDWSFVAPIPSTLCLPLSQLREKLHTVQAESPRSPLPTQAEVPHSLHHPLQVMESLLCHREWTLAMHGTFARCSFAVTALRCGQQHSKASEEGVSAPVEPLWILPPFRDSSCTMKTTCKALSVLAQLTDPSRQSAYDMRDGITLAEQAQLLMLFLFIRILNPTFFFLIKINPQ